MALCRVQHALWKVHDLPKVCNFEVGNHRLAACDLLDEDELAADLCEAPPSGAVGGAAQGEHDLLQVLWVLAVLEDLAHGGAGHVGQAGWATGWGGGTDREAQCVRQRWWEREGGCCCCITGSMLAKDFGQLRSSTVSTHLRSVMSASGPCTSRCNCSCWW